ncbi:hypothetical protein AN958_08135 [Leucoagaricus sp. SymC.cos]|nr:hypothetical protein AN958_08135 [Leucoagaricus sp. SymC.cos]
MSTPSVTRPEDLHAEPSARPEPPCQPARKRTKLTAPKPRRVDEQEKNALFRRPNGTPVMSLPNEVLVKIFQLTLPHRLSPGQFRPPFRAEENSGNRFIIILSAVCRRWRGVAHSTPRLWSSVVLRVRGSKDIEKKIAFLEQCLRLTDTHPLSLSLSFSSARPVVPNVLLDSRVDCLIIRSLPRVEELHLVNPPTAWLSHLTSLSQLVTCTIDLQHNSHETLLTFSEHAPLQQLAVRQPSQSKRLVQVRAPWPNLVTGLTLCDVDIPTGLAILVQCPNLTFFDLSSRWAKGNEPVTLVAPTSLPKMEVLVIKAKKCNWIRAVAQYLSFPALVDLTWVVQGLSSKEPCVQGFFNRLPDSLTSLHLHHFKPQLFRNGMMIKDLTVTLRNSSEIDTVLLYVWPQLRQKGRTVPWEVKPLPSLETLYLNSEEGLSLWIVDDNIILKFLESLGKVKNTFFEFRADIPCDPTEASEKTQRRIKALNRKSGFRIELGEEGSIWARIGDE